MASKASMKFAFTGQSHQIDANTLINALINEEQDIPDQRVVPVDDAVLVITKLSFEKGAVWSFVYNGFRISIPVKDEKLAELIDRGERFGKGDAIRVSLEIVQRYNQTYKVYENKSYKIRDFKEHIEYGGNPLPQTLI